MSSVKHMMFFKKNVKTPLLLEVKVGFVYGLRPLQCKGLFLLHRLLCSALKNGLNFCHH